MGGFALDANCMVAAICAWHQHHAQAKAEINGRLTRGESMLVPTHALVEAYAVVTRLPDPFRMSPADAWRVINASFVLKSELALLDRTAHISLLGELAAAGIGGGRTYDALIAEAAREAGATVLLTFNRRHFEPAPHGLSIVEPTA